MATDNKPKEEKVSENTTKEPTHSSSAPSKATSSGLAIAALVVGIVAVLSGWAPFFGVIVGVAAIVLGVIALKKSAGKGMAIAGLITGAVGAIWSLIVTILFVFVLGAGLSVVGVANQSIKNIQDANKALIESKKDFSKGETANFANIYEVKANSVEENYSPGEYYIPSDGKQFVKVNITVKNISDDSQYVNPYLFSLLDGGIAVSASFTSDNGELTSGDLVKGGSVTGNVIYEVSKDAKDLKLVYKSSAMGTDYSAKELTYTLAI